MNNLDTSIQKWVSDQQKYEKFANVEDTVIEQDKMMINFVQVDTDESLTVEIPMIPTNIDLFAEQLKKAGVAEEKDTDSRGRINLGVDYADQEVAVIVLD